MKKIIPALLVILILGTGYYVYTRLSNSLRVKIFLTESKMTERNEEPILAFYDRENEIDNKIVNSFSHFALILDDEEKWEIEENLLDGLPEDQPVLLTVEIWDTDVLRKTAEGGYDENINQLFSKIFNNNNTVYLRWNPEMEVPVREYPWETIPHLYIKAFNRFSGIVKKISPSTKMVFAPAGYPGALESYPGSEMVDAASITINSHSEQNTPLYKEPSIPSQIYRKLHRMRFIDHPVLILGSANLDKEKFNQNWIGDAIDILTKNKEIVYAVNGDVKEKVEPLPVIPPLMLGLYDPGEELVNEDAVTIEHLFFGFSQIDSGEMEDKLQKVLKRDNDLILSIEPGTVEGVVEDSDVLFSILKGDYDKTLKKFYDILSSIDDRTIYLRFAHEMEIPINRYPWQSKDPVEYIKAYRYFMQFPGSDLENLKRVWGPAGDRGSLEWYPGDDVVDYMSISVYGLPDKNITDPEKQESFEKIYNRKSWRLRFIDKPLFITEFGVKGDENYKTRWLIKAAETLNEEPQVVGVNYFNMTDVPDAWGEIKPPDWSISKNSLDQFIQTLNR